MINTGKYIPIDAPKLISLVRQLQETCGCKYWDVSLQPRGLLVSESEHTKLYGYMGSIRPDHIEEDCNEIVKACLLRIRDRLANVAGARVPVERVVPASSVSA